MPRYLRWIAAITTGIIVQFSFFIAVGAIAVGTNNKELSGGIGLLVSFGNAVIPMLVALAINDWLRTRYPEQPNVPERERV
jgi:hypothetical protein